VNERAHIVVHGHFYQPPRENPWTGIVDPELNAAPDHDWNVRITRECYAPLAQAHAYDLLSFDFGPTLLDWMERESPAVYAAVLAADRAGVRRLGHGNALAMPYHHVILPLCSRRDKETEVRWGIADFERRFGRKPAGFWLPETAVDHETLDVLASAGIAFTVLAPHQVRPVPGHGRAGRVRVASGRELAVFAYDGELSHAIAFSGMAADAPRFAERLRATRPGDAGTLAVDGETFGHHHKGGAAALATVLHELAGDSRIDLTNFAALLAAVPAVEQIEVVANTSWSCSHGVERWRAACGCRTAHHVASQQEWRAPLRSAVDWLAAEVHAIYEREGAALPGGPWAFRDAAGAAGPLPVMAGPAATRLVEMERGVLRAMTSCGWFFDDFAGLEGRQVLRYAAHVIGLAGADTDRLAAGFSSRLAAARSNDAAAGTAVEVFRQLVQPAVAPS
jgi:hypothetical protein